MVERIGGVHAATLQSLEHEVRELIRARRLDPATDDVALRTLVREVVDDFDERALTGGVSPLPDPEEARRLVLHPGCSRSAYCFGYSFSLLRS